MNTTIRARRSVYGLLDLMPTPYQWSSLKAMLVLFLCAQGIALPEHTEHKSPSALSRFLNLYNWPTTEVIRTLRREIVTMLLERHRVGRRPILRAIVDLTPLEKSGQFEGLAGLVHVLNKKRGVQLVLLYLELDGWRIPWGFRVWRGKDSASPAKLALKLLRTLPAVLTSHYRMMVLADSGFCSVEFLRGVRKLGHHAVVGVRRDRRLQNGSRLDQSTSRGERVFLDGLPEVPVYVAAYWLRGRDGTRAKRFVISTRALRAEHIVRWGKRRWAIEGFFRTCKGRFSLQRFGQGTRLGVYRYLLLSMIAYVLAHWGHLSEGRAGRPRWGEAARVILETVLPQTVIEGLLREIKQRSDLLRSHGIEVSVQRCKI
jgi:hypothetical protein